MRAAFYEGKPIRVGGALHLNPFPTRPRSACQRSPYCGICGTDLHIFHGAMDHRVHMPQVLGYEIGHHYGCRPRGGRASRPATA